ncbi:hypothetical protein B0A49_11392 [Cryomyces minteri]|uniref:Conserved oligomeric Golgi complex subunit 6 n=1 Tax=Cryomyces minteri TaxID=331657 RepID=A0A4U0WC40_9PEZI|nr:hypothetical protein B0A49_11392 [Cryomyces minteri]
MASNSLHERSSSTNSNPLAITSPLSPIGPAPRSSALSNRITNVLASSYADLEIRDALETLDARGIKNTQETRRQLRLDVQRELIERNGEIVRDFGQVAEQLKRVGTAIASLNKCCSDMRVHISAADRETGHILQDATSLMSQKKDVEKKQQVLDAFRAHFLTSDTDLTILTSTAEPVNDDFFRVLSRVKKIHKDCQVLLGTESQTLGLEILEQSSKQLNAAFQKLYRWIQREFKTLDLENPQISSSIRRALRVLAERPTLFQNCLDFFAEAREHILSDSFYAALTGSLTNAAHRGSVGKAIELSAHDPLRYVGDMLAWAHSATVSEREALEVLFISTNDEVAAGIRAGIESEPWTRASSDADASDIFDGHKALAQLISRNLAGVARQLRQRVEQVIQSHDDPTLAYKLSNLLGFYRLMFSRLLEDDTSAFPTALQALEAAALRHFRTSMRDHVSSVQGDLAVAPSDLDVPRFVTEALDTLAALMKSYDTSLASSSSTVEREAGFRPVLAEALDPFLHGCENLTQRLAEPANHIFALNCALAVKESLSAFPSFTRQRMQTLDDAIAQHAACLVEYQHVWFLHASGLQPLVSALASLSSSSTDLPPVFAPEKLMATSRHLDAFLPSAMEDARENVKQLKSAVLALEVTEAAAQRLCEDFEAVEDVVLKADGERGVADEHADGGEGARRLREVFPRTSAEIRVLLS